MSGPVQPPLNVQEDDGSNEVLPTHKMTFDATNFTVAKNGTTARILFIGGGGAGTILGSIADTQVAFGTAVDTIGGQADFAFISATTRLGIGTATPAVNLHVVGATYLQNGNLDISQTYKIRNASAGTQAISFPSSGDFAFENVNVGIGTTSPETLLHLETTTISSDSILKIKNTAVPDTTDYATSLVFESTGTPTVNASLLGRIDFNGLDSGGASHNYARIAAVMADKGAGSEDGILKFECTDGGVDFVEHLNMGNGTVTVNDDKKNVIFRVEGDANDSVIRTHATNNNVGIGGIPDAGTALTIFATETPFSTAILRLKNGNTSFPDDTAFGKIEFYNADGNGPGIGASIDALSNGNGAGGWFQFKTGTSGGASTVGMSLDENGVMVVGDYTPLNDVGDDVATIQTDGAISGKLPTILTASGTTTFSPLAHQCRGTSYYFADTGAITMALVSPTAGDNLKIYTPSGGITITMSSGTINGVSSVSRSLATNALLELTCFKDAEYQINNPAA